MAGIVITLLLSSAAGGVCGAIVNIYLAGYNARRAEWSSRVDTVLKDIAEVSSAAIDYWTKGAMTADEKMKSATVIRCQLLSISAQLSVLGAQKSTWTFGTEEIGGAFKDLHEAATGADFDSPNRIVDQNRAVSAGTAASELKTAILSARKALT